MVTSGNALSKLVVGPVFGFVAGWIVDRFGPRRLMIAGILMAGGFPVELPALSLSESYLKPTSMLYRNMLAMEAEELLRAHPVDGAVLMGGCDKTTPALLLGATSMGIPAIFLPAGPMLRGNWQGKTLGSGSDSWKYWDELRAGRITDQDWLGVEGGIARSYGTCMTMGTASTMTAIAEAVGMHESTISRVTTQKFMHTPRGIYELKYFFSSHVSTSEGGECSSTAIRAIIKKLVAAENQKKPLSDSKIAGLLEAQGIQVARRTVAKYRESLGIAPSSERKRLM